MIRFVLLAVTVMGALPALAAPVVFWSGPQVRPGEHALLTGSDLSDVDSVLLSRSGRNTSLEVSHSSDGALAVLIPGSADYGSYDLVLHSPSGVTKWTVNRAAFTWSQGARGSGATEPGSWLRLFGMNLDALAKPVFFLRGDAKTDVPLMLEHQGAWSASLRLPASVAAGRYQLWTHPSGAAATDTGLVVSVLPPVQRLARQVTINVSGSPYAVRDDTPAFLAALEQLRSYGGGTLFIPKGIYHLSAPLVIPDNVRVLGESRNDVNIGWKYSSLINGPLITLGNNTALESLSLFAGPHGHLVATPFDREISHILLRNVTVRANAYGGHISPARSADILQEALKYSSGGPDSLRIHASDVEIDGCDIYGSGRALFLFRSAGAYIHDNRFYNGRLGWYSLSSSSELIFEHNTISGADMMSTGGGVNASGDAPYTRNIYFHDNTLSMMLGWDGEALTSDGPGSPYFGSVTFRQRRWFSLGRNEKQASLSGRNLTGYGLFVIQGRGTGQYAQIVAVDGASVLLDRDFKVPLDTSSRVTIGPLQENFLIVGNRISDAGAAVMFFGAAVNHVVADNVADRSSGLIVNGRDYDGYQPAWYCALLNNTLSGVHTARNAKDKDVMLTLSPTVIRLVVNTKHTDKVELVRGVVIRGNKLSDGSRIEVYGDRKDYSGMSGILREHNHEGDTAVITNAGLGAYFQFP